MRNRKIINRKRRKGFTLIELLAVILILGIIALIAIPTVNNIISESRKGAFRSTVQNIITAAEQQCQLEQLKGDDITNYYLFENGEQVVELGIKGENPTSGSIVVDDECNVSVVLNKDNYIAVKDKDSDEVELIEDTYYTPGTRVTYNPGDSTYSVWHVLKDNGDTVTLLLNRNIGTGSNYAFEWASKQDYEAAGGTDGIYTNLGPLTAVKKLKELTNTWNTEAKENIRLITLEDVLEVLGVNEWDGETLYFDTKSNVRPTVTGVSKYAWLFNNTHRCLKYGCEEEMDDSSPYWTSSKVKNEDMVYVIDSPYLYKTINRETVYNEAGEIISYGVDYKQIRPVITIPKTSIQ